MRDIEVLSEPASAQIALDPVRSKILSVLAEPGSASTVASSMGESRQRINYHLKALEKSGLLRLVEERKRRGRNERVMQSSAKSYVISPVALGAVAPLPSHVDRRSPRYLIAVAARLICDMAELVDRRNAARRPVEPFVVDTEVRLASAAARSEFTRELDEFISDLTARHHGESSTRGRTYRLVVAAHPSVPTNDDR